MCAAVLECFLIICPVFFSLNNCEENKSILSLSLQLYHNFVVRVYPHLSLIEVRLLSPLLTIYKGKIALTTCGYFGKFSMHFSLREFQEICVVVLNTRILEYFLQL